MQTTTELLLTFLLNACWQVPLIFVLASAGDYFLRDTSTRYRHWLWIGALMFSVSVPLLSALPDVRAALVMPSNRASFDTGQAIAFTKPITTATVTSLSDSKFHLGLWVAVVILALITAVVMFRLLLLIRAAIATSRIRRGASLVPSSELFDEILSRCSAAVLNRNVKLEILQSSAVHVPVTFGVLRPVIILPERLISGATNELLLSAVGHELVHVARRDYLLNLGYEILYLPLSFHPIASVIRRRIRQTRELCCDEVVARTIVKPDAYARSLVKLASSAPPITRLSLTTTVGIADADILEARIMSLLRKPKLTARWKKVSLAILSLLLLVPCISAAQFAMRFEIARAQEPSVQQQERKEKESREKEQVEREKTKEVRLRTMNGETRGFAETLDPQEREEVLRKQELELEMREKIHAALARLAKVSMEQAIQVATSQAPGQVLECSLVADHWEEPGKLARDGHVLYHVVIVAGDDASGGATHVLVNAIDGSVFKVEKELPRKLRSAEPR